MKTTRNYAGSYTITANGVDYDVTRFDSDGYGASWFINYADGSRSFFDPTTTLDEAKSIICHAAYGHFNHRAA